jgi:hypothetical protein
MAFIPAGTYYRHTFFFESPRGEGWSESLTYKVADVPDPVTVWANLKTNRLAALSANFYLVYQRVIDPGSPKVVFFAKQSASLVDIGGIIGTSLPGDDALSAICLDSEHRRSTLWFHGLAENFVSDDENPIVTDPQYTAFDAYFTSLAPTRAGVINRGPTAVHPAPTFRYFASMSFGRCNTHKIGRPFGLRRGRTAA